MVRKWKIGMLATAAFAAGVFVGCGTPARAWIPANNFSIHEVEHPDAPGFGRIDAAILRDDVRGTEYIIVQTQTKIPSIAITPRR